MAGLKEINIRIKSVKNTKKITYAMKLVSATKMRSAQDAVLSARDYSEAIESLMQSVLAASNPADLSHPFLEQRDLKKVRLIVLGANRGLCGAFNTNINKAVTAFYQDMRSKNIDVDAVICGSKPEEHFKRLKLAYSKVYTDLGEKVTEWPLDEICRQAEVDFENGEIDAAYVIYTHFKSALSMTAKCKQLLPISLKDLQKAEDAEKNSAASSVAKFEPSGEAVFSALLPRLVQIALMQSALDTKASEHASRMTAMDNATKNAGDLIESLTLKFNKLRQAGITSEILDIVGGANAISD